MPFVVGNKKIPPTRQPATTPVRVSGVLTPKEWAAIIVADAAKLGIKMTPRQVAEGLGVLSAEDNWNASEESQGAGGHIGGWAESPAFGTAKQRLNSIDSTQAALEQWKADGKSWWGAWGQYETGETEGAGPTRYKRYLPIAEAALKGNTTVTAAGGPTVSPAGGGAGGGASNRGGSSPEESTGPSGLGGELLKIALVAVLVLGGMALIGLGGARFVGASKVGKVVQS